MRLARLLATLPWTCAVAETAAGNPLEALLIGPVQATNDFAHQRTLSALSALADTSGLRAVSDAVETMQGEWYRLWIGTWPSAIDWTAAVVNTLVTSASMSFSKASQAQRSHGHETASLDETVNKYFAHSSAFYFAENAFSIRNQAFDDMLWVVLDWLQNIKFVRDHTAAQGLDSADALWHGHQFIPAFAHRARIFHDLASRGWDDHLCGGGMTWNANLEPYKNAITNQLFISASITMYLYFPGDDIKSPFMVSSTPADTGSTFNVAHLVAAKRGYTWLKHSNMTNDRGLYVDGFHITDWSRQNRTGTGRCDARNNMVYTYNQGVILSGLRGLWEATGDDAYLTDAHELVRNVITATGYDMAGKHSPDWSGLGRLGILEDYCDHTGWCNQDAQLFKGIFFQHLIQLCQPLPRYPRVPHRTHGASGGLARLHLNSCISYSGWVRHNAKAAAETRDEHGRFGTWWGATGGSRTLDDVHLDPGSIDYKRLSRSKVGPHFDFTTDDVHDRGRGRTVETQASGLSVTRAAWEFTQLSDAN